MDVRRLLVATAILGLGWTSLAWAQAVDELGPLPYWIWSPEHTQNRMPLESCHFRKEIFLPAVLGGQLDIAADDTFEVFINGKLVGSGSSWEKFTTFDVSDALKPGKNVLAIKATNVNGSTAGMAARLRVDAGGGQPRVYVTNPTWRTSVDVLPMWNRPRYRDTRWLAAQNFGAYGDAEPWRSSGIDAPAHVQSSEALALNPPTNDGTDVQRGASAAAGAAAKARSENNTATPPQGPLSINAPANTQSRPGDQAEVVAGPGEEPQINLPQFNIKAGFRIEHVLGGDETGSLISATFNEFGQLLAGREGGPLLLIRDTNDNNVPDSVQVCCDKIQNCQGIVCVSGYVFVTAEGPEGLALYRLEDVNHDGTYESLAALVRFDGKASEHGPHGVAIGPDGLLYFITGNHSKLNSPVADTSPYRGIYEGDLLTPKYEDPRGHAQGITAPGGCVLRCRQDGTDLELFAGGLRNCYDLVFHPSGDLFTHDSDMETDEGTPWHRPTRLLYVPAGAELGWRSGWSKWPEYWIDTVPAAALTGRGSPTGLVVYEHVQFPEAYRGAIFSCDWAQGQIKVLRTRRTGSGYSAVPEPFLVGKPLNVTDLAIGPDGYLYFVTGGRGTVGHIFRIVWEGEDGRAFTPPITEPTTVAEAVQQPQFHSAWGRQAISVLRHKLGTQWDREIQQYVLDRRNAGHDRGRALEMMHLMGPPPTDAQLIQLSGDADREVRVRATYYLGLVASEQATARLAQLLSDHDAVVRRTSCESLARQGTGVSWEALVPLLRSTDRIECWAARRLLERNPTSEWFDKALAEQTVGAFLQAATARLVAAPDAESATRILERIAEFAGGFVNDADFVDMLRVMQLAMIRGPLSPEQARNSTGWLEAEFPAGNPLITRELATLLAYLQSETVVARMLDYVNNQDIAREHRIHVATRLRFLNQGWTSEQKIQLILFLEQARAWDGGSNLAGYLERVQLDFVSTLGAQDHAALLSRGETAPRAALATLFALPEKPDDATIDQLADLYARLPVSADEAIQQLRIGIIAVMGSRASSASMAYLRAIYDTDPERRQHVAMALAQQPDGRNWDYLVRSIGILEGEPAREVLKQLATVPYAPEAPEHLRQVILAGLRLRDEAGREADALLTHWTQRPAAAPDVPLDKRLANWQAWFAKQYPDQQPATMPDESHHTTWTLDDLLTYLESAEGQAGSLEKGAVVFRQARCADCHRFEKVGKSIGPELTSVVHRFQRKEILESILHPSQVISDQYASHAITLSDGRVLTGLLVPGGNGRVDVVQPDGKTTTVNELDINEVTASQVSSMPEGLLNDLTLEQIRDLFTYLQSGTPPDVAEQQGGTPVRR